MAETNTKERKVISVTGTDGIKSDMQGGRVTVPTPAGPLTFRWQGAAIAEINLPGTGGEADPSPAAGLHEDAPAWVADLAADLQRYFSGGGADLSRWLDRLDRSGITPFQKKVYAIVAAIPPGETMSYGEVAAQAGSPGGARAVGRAMATNPWAPIVPCHRVVPASGGLGGYGGGIALKERLLTMEGAPHR